MKTDLISKGKGGSHGDIRDKGVPAEGKAPVQKGPKQKQVLRI